MNEDRTQWVDVNTFCALMAISRRSAYNWLRAGQLRYERTAGGEIRIDPSSGWRDDTGARTPWSPR